MRNTIFPAYVVIDFSESMMRSVDSDDNRTRIDVAKDIIPTLLQSMKTDATVAESLRVRVIGFNQEVIFCTDLLDYYGLEAWYVKEKNAFETKCKYQTRYGKAFQKLSECINNDISAIVGEGKSYYRPLVYFLTDGKPEGEEDSERDRVYKTLVNNPDSSRNPVVFCVGIGPEDMSVLKQYGASRLGSQNGEYLVHNSKMTFIIRKGVKTGDGLAKLNENVVETIKYSLQKRSETGSNRSREIPIDDTWDLEGDLKRFFDSDRRLS